MDIKQPRQDLQTFVYMEFARRSQILVRLFYICSFIFVVLVFFSAYFVLVTTGGKYIQLSYEVGEKFGSLALVCLGVIVSPGILGRFGIEVKITRVITLFRRQLGIFTFLLAFTHYTFVKLVPSMIGGVFPLSNLAPFELFGLFAFNILFLMFLTSNNASMRFLKLWWKRLHRLIYIVLWLLVLHIGLVRISIWTVFIGCAAMLETVSWIYYFLNGSKVVK